MAIIMINFSENELRVLALWKEKGVQGRIDAKNAKGKVFYFLDGPPYTSGDLHPGQMWVKTIKDVFLRYKRLRGFNVLAKAGYDVHGLPIENKVEKILGIKSKSEIEDKIGVEKFVERCRAFVDEYKGRMDGDFERFGISLDFSKPYMPYDKVYMERVWGIFKKVYDKGYVYNDTKTVIYCPHCGTPISQGTMETVYKDIDSPSIYVAFEVDRKASKSGLDMPGSTYLLIWTTTPWTIPANLAIAANPKEVYVLARSGDRSYIMAKKRLENVSEVTGKEFEVVKEFYGSELNGVKYSSPIEHLVPIQKEMRRYHRVLMAEEMVSMDDGTGLVHMAPAHGIEDYKVCKRYKLPVPNIVGLDACYTKEAGAYAGMSVPGGAEHAILEDLRAAGALLHSGVINHSYPHCWRCSTPLIFIQTNQWFLNIEKAKRRVLRANSGISWHPPEASGWQAAVLSSSPDWCVSRQRYWGIPMPVWKCGKCGAIEVVGSAKELAEKATDRHAAESLHDLHMPHIDRIKLACKCGSEMQRIKDVFDVWIDSSSAFRAALTDAEFEKFFPVDYIVEGSDQLRGWFSGQIKLGVLAYGKAPIKNLGIDGMMLGEDGKEMHKSLGNYRPVGEIIKEHSADAFRLWCTGHTPWLDLIFKDSEIRLATKNIITLQNISDLLAEYSAMVGVDTHKASLPNAKLLGKESLWILSRLESLVGKVTESLDKYDAHDAVNSMVDFFVGDFSRVYLKLAKSRMSDSSAASKAVAKTIAYVLRRLVIMMAPFTPFIAESIYGERFSSGDSVLMESWPKQRKGFIDSHLEEDFEIAMSATTALLNSREKEGVRLRWPLAKARIEASSESAFNSIQRLSDIICDYANVKSLELSTLKAEKSELRPEFRKLGPDFNANASAVAEAIRKSDPSEVMKRIELEGHFIVDTQNGSFKILPEHFTVAKAVDESGYIPFKYGRAQVDRNMDKGLMMEALSKEFIRRIQMERKRMGLKKSNRITVLYGAKGELGEAISSNAAAIAKAVNAQYVKEGRAENSKEADIDGELISIAVSQLHREGHNPSEGDS